MDTVSVILLAVGLSMDSFAVSVSNGLTIRELTFKKALPIAFSFAFFQALLPFTGWIIGSEIEKYVIEFDHWIAFFLLSVIGLKMIYESITLDDNNENTSIVFSTIIWQSIATSIDALVVGIGFALLDYPIFTPVFMIGAVTFLFSMIGLRLGKFLGKQFEKTAIIFGGLILILLGSKILYEHTML